MVAGEFAAQGENIDPVAMPVTVWSTRRSTVSQDPQAVLEDILRFSSTDLLCYRADAPEKLIARQAEAWDPVIDWARATLGARFVLAEGVMHVEQPREAIGAIGVHLKMRDEPLRLAALHLMTSLTGSALLALAVDAWRTGCRSRPGPRRMSTRTGTSSTGARIPRLFPPQDAQGGYAGGGTVDRGAEQNST